MIDDIDYSFYFPNHISYVCKAKQSLVGGRPMGGVLVLVNERLGKLVKRICEYFEFGIILILDKTLLDVERDCVYISVYIPPDGSPFYHNSTYCGLNTIENIINNHNLTDFHIVLNGDLNARTGTYEDAIVTNIGSVPELSEFEDIINSDLGTLRSNSDTKVNKYGKQLITVCQSYELRIVNGRFGKDTGKGDYTFFSTNGCSVIDYFIVSKPIINIISNFQIISYPESSHMPVLLMLKCPFVSNHVIL